MRKIWVDADAFPVVLKDILCRSAERTEEQTTFVEMDYSQYNQKLQTVASLSMAANFRQLIYLSYNQFLNHIIFGLSFNLSKPRLLK